MDSWLYDLQSRYYDPVVKRFINADDVAVLDVTSGFVTGANLFSYCTNNPVMYVDPTGLITIPRWIVSFIVDIFISAVGLGAVKKHRL